MLARMKRVLDLGPARCMPPRLGCWRCVALRSASHCSVRCRERPQHPRRLPLDGRQVGADLRREPGGLHPAAAGQRPLPAGRLAAPEARSRSTRRARSGSTRSALRAGRGGLLVARRGGARRRRPRRHRALPQVDAAPLSFERKFELQSNARDAIRQMILENALDDRHDLTGNTVFGLKFDTSVLPGSRTMLEPHGDRAHGGEPARRPDEAARRSWRRFCNSAAGAARAR